MICQNPFVRLPTGGFKPLHMILDRKIKDGLTPLPCGQCLHCRINKHREWKNRLLLEDLAHEESCFLTLTYNDENLPPDNVLHLPHLQKFFKKLRNDKALGPFRYFAVGEYGTSGEREFNPHYHIAVFGHHQSLAPRYAKHWGMGFVSTADINKDTASYIVGYTLKKLTRKGDKKLDGKPPEFSVSSKRGGGIGIKGIEKIVERLKASGIDFDKPFHEINYGGYKMPLGRYLTDKMAEKMGLTEKVINLKEEYRENIIYDALNKSGVYRDNIIEVDEQKRKKQRKRHSIRQSTKVRRL